MRQKDHFTLEVITPERVLISKEVTSVVLPAGKGSMGILPGHSPLIATMGTGILKMRDIDKQERRIFVSKGFVMVSLEGVSVLARSAETKEMIDKGRVLAAKERAEKRLAHRVKGVDVDRAKEALSRAQFRLKVMQDFGN